ncbi:hypothetical protein TNCV_1370951 [Trichonephila clavipes]|nr:hypothetical protein TNCV_1370951 [Trichonephila clavipes]
MTAAKYLPFERSILGPKTSLCRRALIFSVTPMDQGLLADFSSDRTVKTPTETWFNRQGPDFYQDGLNKFVLRSDKCLNRLERFQFWKSDLKAMEKPSYTVRLMTEDDVPQTLDVWRSTGMQEGTHCLYTWLKVDPGAFQIAVTDSVAQQPMKAIAYCAQLSLRDLGTGVHVHMFRSRGQSDAKPPVFASKKVLYGSRNHA